jgi:signal transduction histidine kinase
MGDTIHSTAETISNTSPESQRDWLAILAAIIAALALVTLAWLEKVAWDKMDFAENTLQRAHSAPLNSGANLQESLATLKLELLLFQVSGGEENRALYQSHARQLSSELAQATAAAQNPSERAALENINKSVQQFLNFAENLEPHKTVRRGTIPALSAELDEQLTPVVNAVSAFTSIQNETRRNLATQSAQAFTAARRALQSSLIALLALLAAIGLLVHRALFLPLKNRLDATAAAGLRNQKLASLGVLATGVAHEIRNPLTAIKLRLFSLKKALGATVSDNDDFQTIHSEIDRLERLTKSFLEFARPPEPQRERINSSDLLQKIQRLLEPELARRNIKIAIEAADNLDFSADPQQLQQVLINLAQNGADSMASGGTITLRAHSGSAAFARGRESAVMLDVIDTGIGIEPHVQERLFDPFFSTKEGGTGLGLAIAARIVEQHGGLMQFSTRPNQGSTFTIVLPKERTNAPIENSAHRG